MSEINQMTDEKLVHRELDLERQLVQFNFQHRSGQLDDHSVLSKTRKAIAQSRTEQRRRELEGGLSKDHLRRTHRPTFKPSTELGGAVEAAGGFLQGIKGKLGIEEDGEESSES
jgi:large subunit ribosomal protein L29